MYICVCMPVHIQAIASYVFAEGLGHSQCIYVSMVLLLLSPPLRGAGLMALMLAA